MGIEDDLLDDLINKVIPQQKNGHENGILEDKPKLIVSWDLGSIVFGLLKLKIRIDLKNAISD